jgi:hypothetical protein
MRRTTLFILIEDEICTELDKDKKAALHLNQKSYWQAHYSDRISYDTFYRIYGRWLDSQKVSA